MLWCTVLPHIQMSDNTKWHVSISGDMHEQMVHRLWPMRFPIQCGRVLPGVLNTLHGDPQEVSPGLHAPHDKECGSCVPCSCRHSA